MKWNLNKKSKDKRVIESIKEINSTKENKMVISLEQRQVYSEVLEVLRHMDKFYVEKIPKKLIMFFYDNCSLDYEFRMTKSIGEENLQENTLNILALLNMNYWSKNTSKEDLIMNYAIIDKKTQAQLNSQLERKNIFTKIDVKPEEYEENPNLPVTANTVLSGIKKVLNFIKVCFIKFFGD